MKSEVAEVVSRLEQVERSIQAFERTGEAVRDADLDAYERSWIGAARTRLQRELYTVRSAVEQGIALPELKGQRLEKRLGLERAWLTAARELFDALGTHVGPTSPLIEALFPHAKFEKLERLGTAFSAFRAEFAVRRRSTYVCRLAADPEYPFLSGLLEPIDELTARLSESAAADNLDEDAADELRRPILGAGERLLRALAQARALCQAALIDHPEILAELGLDERAKKRAARNVQEPVSE